MSVRQRMSRAGIVAGVVIPLVVFGPQLKQVDSGELGLAILIAVGTGLGVWALCRALGAAIDGLLGRR